MTKVIFINRYCYPDQSATSQILTDLLVNINGMTQAALYVVTSRNTYENDQKLRSFEDLAGIQIHRVWTSRFGRRNLIGRAVDYLTFYISTFFRLMFLVRPGDIVVAKTDPPVISYIAYIVVKLKGARQINWIQDLFPDIAGALNVLRRESAIYRLLSKLNKRAMENSIMNVAIGERMAARLVEQGIKASRIDIVHNWNINKNIEYVDKDDNELLKEWGLEEKFVVGYSGNFGRAHEYQIIEGLVEHCRNREDIAFLFIGGGKYYDDLQAFVRMSDIQNVLFKPYQESNRLNLSLSVADIHLISLKPELEGLIVPSKFYGLASIGALIVFIGSPNGEIGDVLTKNNAGYVIRPDDGEKLYKLIDQMSKNMMSNSFLSKNLNLLYQEKYQPSIAYDQWVSILKSAIK